MQCDNNEEHLLFIWTTYSSILSNIDSILGCMVIDRSLFITAILLYFATIPIDIERELKPCLQMFLLLDYTSLLLQITCTYNLRIWWGMERS